MDDMSLIYNINLCRICQVPNNLTLINCSVTEDERQLYVDRLKYIFSDIVWIDNDLIYLTCKICLDRIKDAAEFKRICLETNSRRATLNSDSIKDHKLNSNNRLDKADLSNLIKDKRKHVCKLDILDKLDNVTINDIEIVKNISGNGKTCRICKRIFSTYKRLEKHTNKAHPKHLFYHCDACEETFPTKDYSDRHGFKHHGIKKYICTACGSKYITRSDLTHHMHNHKDKPAYICKICPDKRFQTSNSLTKHKMLVHSDPKQFKHLCTECGAKFAMASGLRVHLMRHANIRNFSCHLCEKNFCTKNELKSHSVSHSNVRQYKCDLCPAEYKLRSVLLKHKAKMHGIGNYKYTEAKKYSCSYCSKNVFSKCKLLRHIRTHTGVKPFKCRLCDVLFICKSYVKSHVRGKHKVDVDADDFNVKLYYDVCETGDVLNHETGTEKDS